MAFNLLMCPPDYFEVAYEINPWMSIERRVHQEAAQKQWQDYYNLLTGTLKVKVELLEPVRGLPDLVFTANGGIVHKRLFVRSNFRHKERKGEEPYFEKWFKKKGYKVKTIGRPLCFEGEGDALMMGKDLYTGFHFRSDVEAHDAVSGHLNLTYFALELCDERFYHLDTCFAPLNEKSALVYFPAFEPYAQLVLWENVSDPIQVPENEAVRFACNAVVLGTDVVMPDGCPQTTAELEKRGFRVYPLDFSEFMKAGGAAKCLVLKI
ncbi:MAG TPA: arginine deiminase-related protein [Verrucomicrobiae bacterium]|nr:arginine deiminase-related protein [Verrucomicrobiae bacterium]